MFFDEAKITVRAGRGGNGCIGFRREKFVPYGGPDGGDGGGGGDVILRVNGQLNTLSAFRHQRHYVAENGGAGSGNNKHGANGQHLYVEVPAGTIVRDGATGDLLGDLTAEHQELQVAVGGRGGRGNEAFKTSTRQTPRFAEKGAPGQGRSLRLELKLIADVGLLGKPNAGKSTLLSRVSAARPKIADYPFTTLEPNLGVAEVDGRTLVIADIPGLIEGAHEGAGLGLEFLRHVERTRLLVHLLDGASPDPAADYAAINRELALYSEPLAAKPQMVVLNKLDLPDAREQMLTLAQRIGVSQVWAISAVTGEGLPVLMRAVADRVAQLPREALAPELYVFRPQPRLSKAAFTVEREGPGVYRVRGEEIERLAMMTDWDNEEGLERFERIMVARGIAARLDEAGVAVGDTVHIGEMELEWR